MLKFIAQSFGIRHLEKIQTSVDQKFGPAINSLSKQIIKKCYSQECKYSPILTNVSLIIDQINHFTAAQPNINVKQVGYVPFLEKIEHRKSEARRSIVVQVQSEQSYKELHSYCNSIGIVHKMFHYTTGIEPLV